MLTLFVVVVIGQFIKELRLLPAVREDGSINKLADYKYYTALVILVLYQFLILASAYYTILL